jgi:DNA-binding transcriptional ArsR family regulator
VGNIDATQLLGSLVHPQRRDILRQIYGKDAISPKELSDEMGVPLSNICYHVSKLAECDAIVLVGTKPVRGSMQHFYRFNVKPEWALQILGLSAV